MKQLLCILCLSIIIYSCTNNAAMKRDIYQWPKGIQPPIADKKTNTVLLHGDTLKDDYYWMNAYFKKTADSTKVVNYLKEENNYLDTMMRGNKIVRENLFTEMKARIKEKDESAPVWENGYYYYKRNDEGKQYFKYCRKKATLEATEEILLDVDQMAEGHSYFSAISFRISPNNKLLAYGVDTVSRRQYTIYIKNLETGKLVEEKIALTDGHIEWANDSKTFFYTAINPVTLLSEKINKHQIGSTVSDAAVYEEKDKSNYIEVTKTRSGKYIVINSANTLSSESRVLAADKPDQPFTIFQNRMKEVLYTIDHWADKFLIVTNWEAKNFRLMETPIATTDRQYWKELIPNRSEVLLANIDVFNNFWVITERKNGLLHLQIQNKTNPQQTHYLNFGEPAYTAYVADNLDYSTAVLRYQYSSLTTPNSTFDYNMNSKEKKLVKQQEVVGGYDAAQFTTERIYATATDGVKVPISLVYKKGMKKEGNTPLLLYGYGSYGNSRDAAFNSNLLSLLNRGFIFAIAHIRGGQEMGRQWYEDGKMLKKKNTFTDFIDCANFLIKEKYTSTPHLYARGGSAGGLLMGAILNMQPNLWHGVIAQVPFVDVINTMLDESIPLTTNEFDEWGNPKNKEAYQYMKTYSPYDNVSKQAYPNLLVTTGLHDSQVQYFEPAKWVAKLRTYKIDNNLLLLHTNMDAGHGGASGRFNYLKEVALQYAFLLSLENINE
jgi:oligopeptidase B